MTIALSAPGSSDLDAARDVRVERFKAGRTSIDGDAVAVELPIALSFNGISHAVMLATPADLDAMALGFALSEGVLASADECYDIEVTREERGFMVEATIASRAFASLKQRRRAMEGRSGCGLCGIDSLTAFDFVPPMNGASRADAADIAVQAILAAIGDLGNHQPLNDRTGGCHAAGWALPDGRLVLVQEDVGRHNALDKLIGRLAVGGLLGTPGFAVVSSRASYELARKCAAVGIPLLAAISAPSSLAIDLATQTGLRLYGFVRNTGAVRYDGGGAAGRAPATSDGLAKG